MNSLSDGEEGADEGAEGGRNSPLPAKRVRVSDINITRYEKSSVSDPVRSGTFPGSGIICFGS